MIETVCLIYSKGDPKWVQSEPIWDRSPWVETKHGYELLKEKEGPRLISSHLPIQLFPKSFFKSKAKVSVQRSRQSSSGLPRWASGALLFKSCPTLFNPMDCNPPGSSSLRFSRQEYWSGLPCPPPGDLPKPGIEAASPVSPTLQMDYLLLSQQESPNAGDTSSVPGRGSSACHGVQPKNKNIK